MILTWADAHFCAAHRDDRGFVHGHTWRVRAYWEFDGQDMQAPDTSLAGFVLSELDHRELPANLSWAEQIAPFIGAALNCVQVDVWREPEGLGATWRA